MTREQKIEEALRRLVDAMSGLVFHAHENGTVTVTGPAADGLSREAIAIVEAVDGARAALASPSDSRSERGAFAALLRVAERYATFCLQAGVEANASSLDPAEQLHAQALAAIAKARQHANQLRTTKPVESHADADLGNPPLRSLRAALRPQPVTPGDSEGAKVLVRWQCSGCRWGFTGPHRVQCPACMRQGYWTGSVEPGAQLWPPMLNEGHFKPAPASALSTPADAPAPAEQEVRCVHGLRLRPEPAECMMCRYGEPTPCRAPGCPCAGPALRPDEEK